MSRLKTAGVIHGKIGVMGWKIILSLIIFFSFGSPALAQDAETNFYRCRVREITNEGQTINASGTFKFQEVKLDCPVKGEIILNHGEGMILTDDQLVSPGETVIVSEVEGPDGTKLLNIADKYRLNKVWPLIAIFFLLVIFLARWKGVGSIAGMIISLGVILFYIVPQIVAGANPLTVTIAGSIAIMISTIYLAHGFSAKTTIAVVSTFITLITIAFISSFVVKLAHLTGLGSEDAASLRFGLTSHIDFRGLLLGGIIIGSLGVLDDITTGLSATIFEIKKANNRLKPSQLFASGLEVGKEHVTSLVNTLILAYAGTALPVFMIISLNINKYPIWLILNDELIMEELVRTLAGSIGIIAAVPLTAFLAVAYLTKPKKQ
jgi:uncharacterized membrane protein